MDIIKLELNTCTMKELNTKEKYKVTDRKWMRTQEKRTNAS